MSGNSGFWVAGNRFAYPNQNHLHALRFHDGDVVIKLGQQPEDVLLVHKSVLQAHMPYLDALLRVYPDGRKWTASKSMIHPSSGENMDIFTLTLKEVEDTLVLSGEQDLPLINDRHSFLSITSSGLCDGWMDEASMSPTHAYPKDIALAHKALLAILYGFPITFDTSAEDWPERHYQYKIERAQRAAYLLRLVCGYAEYYGGLDVIATRVAEILTSHEWFWKAVAEEPRHAFILGEKLRSTKIYFDALSHMIARARNGHYEAILDFLSITRDEAQEWIVPLHEFVDYKVPWLQDELFSLQLSESWATWNGDSYTPLTTYGNMLEFKHPDREEGIKALERAALLARSIYGQWILQQLYGERVYQGHKIRSSPAGTLAWAIHMLKRAQTWHSPANLFGRGVVDRYVADFQSGSPFNVRKQIEAELTELINKAVEKIDRVFQPGSTCWSSDSTLFMCRWTEVMKKDGYLTFFPLDENDVPWEDEREFTASLVAPQVSMEPASVAVLHAVGIDG